jgi:uncharacterized protein YggE
MNRTIQPAMILTAGAFVFGGLISAGSAAAQERPAVERGPTGVATQPAPERAEGVEVRLAVSNFATNATAARAATELDVQRVLRAVGRSGVQIGVMRSEGVVLVPEFAPVDPVPLRGVREDPRVIGYRAVGEIRVFITDLGRVGHLLDTARGAGAYPVRSVLVP